jgi:hypothetical protein
MDGGRGIGAISVTWASGTVEERSAFSPASASPAAPRPISSSKLTFGSNTWITSPDSTPVLWPLSSRKVSHRIEIPYSTMTITVAEIDVADPLDAWVRAGFSVDADAVCRVGGVRIRLVGSKRGTGILGWSLRGLPPDDVRSDLDGIPTTRSDAISTAPAAHPNGVTTIDHVVLLSPDLDRTVESLAAVGAVPRREREGQLGGRPIRQIFFRFGEVIVEVVGSPGPASQGLSTLWGITYVVADIDATAAYFGDRTAPVREAVQPGRRITTLRHHELGMSVRSAMISGPIVGS